MDKNKIFQVKNRSASMAIYNIPEDNIRREFAPGETKRITFDELEKLSYQPGGRELMANFLQIIEEAATEALGIHREPEYNLSEEQIIELLKNGNQDAFLDALDFAPTGVIDLIKKFAVSLPLSDLNKIAALKEKTGFDVTNILANLQAEKEDDVEAEKAKVAAPVRRVTPAVATTTPARRTSGQYKVVSQKS